MRKVHINTADMKMLLLMFEFVFKLLHVTFAEMKSWNFDPFKPLYKYIWILSQSKKKKERKKFPVRLSDMQLNRCSTLRIKQLLVGTNRVKLKCHRLSLCVLKQMSESHMAKS